ncbi:MAG TPA: glycosyltransferase [Acidimicrobiales bacterium]|nr:glycosyltransferase [Acidimicrobiales bacterium]
MPTKPPNYRIYVSRRGNVFMAELAELLTRTLVDLGRHVVLLKSGLPERQDGSVNIVVAPHELFHFAKVGGASPVRLAQAAADSVCVTTEQMGTAWFELQNELCAESPLILDINRTAVDALRRRGLPSEHLQLGYHESIDHWHGQADQRREVDVAVLAAQTDRRDRFLAHAATLLWDRNCDIRLFTFDRPVTGTEPGFLVGGKKFDHLARSKMLLNVHRSDVAYFEWLRVIEAVANGCAVVTEASLGCRPFVPFEHFVQGSLEVLAEYALAVLLDEGWRAQLASAAYEFMRDELDMVRIVNNLLPRIEAVADGTSTQRLPARRKSPTPPPSSVSVGSTQPPSAAVAAHQDIRMAVDVTEARFREMAKTLLMSQRSGIRQIEKIESALHHGTDDYMEIETTPSYRQARPEVSIVLTNYNYEALVGETIESVVASVGIVPELIVVDDHSVDDSLNLIRELMARRPWFPTMLVSKHANLGLSEARNTGFRHARAEHVFVLDADNLVYPSGIATLLRTIRAHGEDYAMAYGVIDCFADAPGKEPVGLVSCLPWDPYRLTCGNYIDAMALIRRSAWEAVGGYDWNMDEHFGGWEDFDLWLRFASQGYSAAFVSTPVARYRVHGTSMLQSFNWAPGVAFDELRRRYPGLPWPPRQATE